MGITDYHSKKEDLATVPLVAHELIVAKHKRREFALAVALTVTIIVTILTFIL